MAKNHSSNLHINRGHFSARLMNVGKAHGKDRINRLDPI